MERLKVLKSGMVIVDKREKRSSVPSLLIKHGLSVRFDILDVGDYALPGDVLIERKTVSDFVSSILDGRLFGQALNLSRVSANPTFIIEGDIKNCLTFFENVNAFWGALASLMYDFKIRAFFTNSPEDTATLVYVIANRRKKGGGDIWVKPKKKKASVEELQIFILTSLPGIGPTTAKRLLKALGSLREVFNAEPNVLSTLGKISSEKSKQIYELINAKYSDYKNRQQSKIDGF